MFGHSMGAVIAFEAARGLVRRGITPAGLLASGSPAPGRPRRRGPVGDDELIADLGLLAGTGRELLEDEAMLRIVLPVLRADYALLDSHRPAPGVALPCPITALTGDRDPRVTPEEAEEWRTHTSADFHLGVFPGGHFFLDEHAPDIRALILDRLGAPAAS